MTTPDPFDKVVAYYAKKRGTAPDARPEKGLPARAVFNQDDTVGRRLSIRVFIETDASSTTTLVISWAKDEKETPIAWTHYRRLEVAPTRTDAVTTSSDIVPPPKP